MNSMLAQIHSLPSLIRESAPLLDDAVRAALEPETCRSLRRLFVAGCGDSHHAALSAEHALEALSGLPCEPMTALQFARYAVGFMPESNGNCFIGVSVSGEVARTVEALRLARQAGAATIALTATPGSRIAQAADRIVSTQTAPFPDPPGAATPGVRSYVANVLALVSMAVRIGEARGRLAPSEVDALQQEIARLADAAEQTIAACAEPARALAADWADASDFVFCGSGPNYGTALFCAAKLLEATGDPALGQDVEEWAHLQYFARAKATPTFLISAGDRDLSRAIEVAIAARAIGRRVVAICPPAAIGLRETAAIGLPLAGGVREMFTPLIAAIPVALFAAYRADLLGEPFFRGFGGGRSREGGGGASRIRTSDMWETVRGAH
jgi:glucosamine--fructose-6-phosphate aminotransferase (isomerizing)